VAKAKYVDQNHDNSLPMDNEDIQREEVMESIVEDEDPDDDPTPAAILQAANQSTITAESNNIGTNAQNPEDMVKPEEGKDETTKDLTEVLAVDVSANSKNPLEDKPTNAEDKEPETLDEEPEPIREVDPKEWRRLHDEWLHAAMRAAMGDTTLTTIPDLDNVECMECNPPQNRVEVEPARLIVRRYDLCLKVAEGEDQINLFHQAFTKWYNKVREADSQIILYPWTASDRAENPMPVIKNPMDIPLTLPNLKKFVHKLFLRTTGGDYHIQVLMGSQEDLVTIMQTIGWWHKSTFQGMWLMDLQSAKETTCAGWLLFSAGDYDREALSHKIWEFTGVQVAIRFRVIEDGKKQEKM